MSRILMIRHLPITLSFHDKEQLLKHFGAEKVWETSSKRNYVFAAFANIDTAKATLTRLHQLELARRRLVVEYSFEKEPVCYEKNEDSRSSEATKHVREFIKVLNAWNPSVDFHQPAPVHLKYKYPEPNPTTLINIVHALVSHRPLYIQALHLMNKMSLNTPFENNEVALQTFKEIFRHMFIDEIQLIPQPESEPESEISSDEEENKKVTVSNIVKRKHTLPKTRKRPANILSTATVPKVIRIPVNQNEVFETVPPVLEQRKISVLVAQDALQKTNEEPEVVGELGKFQKEERDVPEEPQTEPEKPTITKKELLHNRISYSDMKVLPVFRNYHPGQPSMRLYIKNLAKTVSEQDVKRIYRLYIENLSEEEQNGFDVRVMQEGRMKGQGFVTFPSTKLAEKALNETNGYMLKERPMVVQFARVANKKTVD